MSEELLAVIAILVILTAVIIDQVFSGKEVKDMRLTYKLVIEKDGTTTEEPFENYEAMLERVKALSAAPAQPAAPADAGVQAATPPAGTEPPAPPVPPAV
jgi:hypothetical protein